MRSAVYNPLAAAFQGRLAFFFSLLNSIHILCFPGTKHAPYPFQNVEDSVHHEVLGNEHRDSSGNILQNTNLVGPILPELANQTSRDLVVFLVHHQLASVNTFSQWLNMVNGVIDNSEDMIFRVIKMNLVKKRFETFADIAEKNDDYKISFFEQLGKRLMLGVRARRAWAWRSFTWWIPCVSIVCSSWRSLTAKTRMRRRNKLEELKAEF